MLRIDLLQQFFGHWDPAMEEALHDIALYREFSHLDVGITRLPDESTILRPRHLLEEHRLGQQILATVNVKLIERGLAAQDSYGGRCASLIGRARLDQEQHRRA